MTTPKHSASSPNQAAHGVEPVPLAHVGGACAETDVLVVGYGCAGAGTPAQEASGLTDTAQDMARYLTLASGPDADEEKTDLCSRENLERYA